MRKLRCAIYTRKSSEEGLEQSFNSLDAQREACAAYVKSQAHEGWVPLPTLYDDGGFSGGSMERPGLKALLADIATGLIDIVVVYKVDRLTRSLADFARIIDVLDREGVSFVSVTQQFSTTSSMGRLTLNMLLSFAQFEREVTAERIRDKVAASKAKGMWMGGLVPFGYDADRRTLKINEPEAETVRRIHRLYLELGCVRGLAARAEAEGLRGKIRNGAVPPPFSRGHLYRILSNPIYIGKIGHKGKVHPGLHPAIIDPETWDAVQARLADNRNGRREGRNAKDPSLLAGMLYDGNGQRMTPVHANKGPGQRYRYYVTQSLNGGKLRAEADGLRLPAAEVESLVLKAVSALLADEARLFALLDLDDLPPDLVRAALDKARALSANLELGSQPDRIAIVRNLLARVTIGEAEARIELAPIGLRQALGVPSDSAIPTEHPILTIPSSIRRIRGVQKLIVGGVEPAPEPDPALTRLIAKGHAWFEALSTGKMTGVAAIAEAEDVTSSYVTRLTQLAQLPPDILIAMLDGHQPVELSADRLMQSLPLLYSWEEQREELNFCLIN